MKKEKQKSKKRKKDKWMKLSKELRKKVLITEK